MSIRQITHEYQAYINSDKWNTIRIEIKMRDGNRCRVCGSGEKLQVHHISGRGRFHEEKHPETLMTLCDKCHSTIHAYFMQCDILKDIYKQQGKA